MTWGDAGAGGDAAYEGGTIPALDTVAFVVHAALTFAGTYEETDEYTAEKAWILTALPGVRVFGITDPARIAERCPTIACRIGELAPLEVARRLDEQGIADGGIGIGLVGCIVLLQRFEGVCECCGRGIAAAS